MPVDHFNTPSQAVEVTLVSKPFCKYAYGPGKILQGMMCAAGAPEKESNAIQIWIKLIKVCY